MKKIFLAALAVGLVSTSAMALDGTATSVESYADGTIKVEVGAIKKQLVGKSDAIKAMTAIALTANASSRQIRAVVGTYEGNTGWNFIKILPAP